MYSEKTNLIEKKGSPFYGSYKETSNVLDEIHWQNKKKQRQLLIVTIVILIVTLLGIGITLAITLPPLLDRDESRRLDPVNPADFSVNSTSVLEHYANAGVSSEDGLCSTIGKNIMQSNEGTAVDAAIGVALCLGVVSPQSSGLGGGLFMTVYSDRTMYAINGRETAPQNIDPQVYVKDPKSTKDGGLAVGVPGELAGLWEAHQRFGVRPWAEVVKPARDLAQNGFGVSPRLATTLKKYQQRIIDDPVLRSEFINPTTGEPWLEGEQLKRPRLAKTLESIEKLGASDFYNGTIAAQIVEDVAQHGGVLSEEDLSTYSAEWVDPIVLKYRNNLTMFTLPFPSSGPVVSLALGILDGYGKLSKEPTPIENGIDHHRLVETLKFAETHRAQISDPNFDGGDRLDNLLDKLTSFEYADELRAKIQDYTTASDPKYYGAVYSSVEDSGTTHISILGPNGDAVSLTSTINKGFGAGFMGNLTGIIFNNEIDDFSFPNITDAYGLPTNPHNYAEPGKQPASSMAPLIFLNAKGRPVLATGGSGGLAIVSSVITATWGALYRNMDIKQAIDYPRFIVKFNPTAEIFYEYGLPAYLIHDLERKGQHPSRYPLDFHIGNVNSVCLTKSKEEVLANADYRKLGGSAGF